MVFGNGRANDSRHRGGREDRRNKPGTADGICRRTHDYTLLSVRLRGGQIAEPLPISIGPGVLFMPGCCDQRHFLTTPS